MEKNTLVKQNVKNDLMKNFNEGRTSEDWYIPLRVDAIRSKCSGFHDNSEEGLTGKTREKQIAMETCQFTKQGSQNILL